MKYRECGSVGGGMGKHGKGCKADQSILAASSLSDDVGAAGK
jgi:hypothetical protein